ncbi:WD40 repeat domain-containing protein [Chloropicon primus]|uniref:WD40 repeat domain-containing protein n=1 Tax=Chloropicon primus TaxID=1764295 RepID=A0A5B8ML02_9CHLO|nr:WD40 repeat domain-containing protein [Chloropicon primus]UPQ99282.1 WD40 repeat domain-containing protein [Chloropicon primus]|mmetsp:Transcript_10608/g.29950  ORF Transcript_10608/g.29950 Transcript_10608/m.29950 type:complete len:470 (-) Transcript_10608:51-1460(-)|eukprot:QDZ20070.1 WD40 repeat domain-containing protein [Chloropicon primus]
MLLRGSTTEGSVDYEKAREEQIMKNKERMLELKLLDASAQVAERKTPTRKASQRGVKRQKRSEPVVARRSLRVRGMKPSGEMIASESANGSITLTNGGSIHAPEPSRPSRKTGPVKFESIYEDDEDEAAMLELLRAKGSATTSSSSGRATSAADLANLSLAEENCVKVTKNGASHVGIMPRSDFAMIAAGDKDGRVGLWNLSKGFSQVNVQVQPHTQYMSGLKWCPTSGRDLFTCSYDGTCRRLDVNEGVFQEIYSCAENHVHEFSAFDVDSAGRTVYLCDNEGEFLVADARTNKPVVKPFEMHHRKINTVHIEPSEGNLFATSCTGGDVGVWDLRKLPRAVEKYAHAKSCQAAYFSPDGSKRVLTTCYDSHLSIWDFKKNKSASVRIKHNTQTGRWTLPFRAIWTPAADGIVCGSMRREVFIYSSVDGKRISSLSSDFLTAIPSRFFVHPALPLLGAATSSGRIALFS